MLPCPHKLLLISIFNAPIAETEKTEPEEAEDREMWRSYQSTTIAAAPVGLVLLPVNNSSENFFHALDSALLF